ncbi:hypothetical protein Tco_0303070 [Tanacetum coccineum]
MVRFHPDSPAPKPAKSTKPKVTKQAKPVAPKAATKKPQPAPTKPMEKKRKQDKETTEATPPAKRTKAGKVAKKRTLKRSQQLVMNENAPVVKSGDQDEGQAGPDPGIQDKGQAGPNPDDVAESLPLLTPGVHAGPNLKHTNAEATDATSQPQPGHIDEEFTTTTYPNIKRNLYSYVDQADNEKTTADTEAESMVSVTIHQDTSAIPPMTSPVIDLVSRPDSPNVHQPLPTTTTATATTITTIMTTIPLPPQPQQGNASNIRERFIDLREKLDMKEILHNRMWESKSYQTHEDHMTLYEALEKSMARDNSDQLLSNLAEARKKKKKRQGSPKTPPGSPPPPPSPAGPFGTSCGSLLALWSSSITPPPPSPSKQSVCQSTSTAAVPSSSNTALQQNIRYEQAYSSSGEDVGRDHIPL